MKLIRFGEPSRERPGLLLPDGRRIDASALGADYDEAFFGSDGLERLARWLEREGAAASVVADGVRLGPPLCRPSKIVCVGLNYRDHARESGMAVPDEPVLFCKATSAISGPNDDVLIPRNGTKLDWEVELAVVIGRRTAYVERDEALRYVAGYVLHNDYSERAFQLEHGGQWVKGKSCDSFAPLGPFLATPDEIRDVHDLRLWLKVNGTTKQCSSTRELIFDVPALVSYISKFMTLLPGDIICTGIGRASALRFGREGAQLVLADIQDAEGEAVVQAIAQAGGTACFVRADVGRRTDSERMIDVCVERYGRLDILFCNAGITLPKLLPQSVDDEIDRVLDVNVKGPLYAARRAIPVMLGQAEGGVILFTASKTGLVAQTDSPVYCASKGAVVLLAKALALDYAARGIRVNALCPGIIDTPMLHRFAAAMPDPAAAWAQYGAAQPLGRLGTPEECAAAALWLVSPEASFVTGVALPVDGGFTAM